MPSNPHILHIPNHQTTKPTYLRPRFKKMWNCNHFHNKTKQTHRRTQPTQPKRIYGVHTIISTMFIRFFAAWEGYNGPHIHTYWNWLQLERACGTEYQQPYLQTRFHYKCNMITTHTNKIIISFIRSLLLMLPSTMRWNWKTCAADLLRVASKGVGNGAWRSWGNRCWRKQEGDGRQGR